VHRVPRPGPSETGPVSFSGERPLNPKKTLQQRQKELQSLLATPAGRDELQALGCRYSAASGRERAGKASVITYILVYERERGLIGG
jgi:hypothetical protein